MCALVLVAEDDPKHAELMSLYLRNGGHSTIVASDGHAALEQIRGWPVVVPVEAVAAGTGAALLLGALAGMQPAMRAPRLLPTEALATP